MASSKNISFPKKNWTEEIHKFLSEHIPATPGLAAFDFDNTLVKNDFGEAVMNEIIAAGLPGIGSEEQFAGKFRDRAKAVDIWLERLTDPEKFSSYIWSEYQRIMKEAGLEAAYRWSSFIFSGWTEKDLKRFTRSVWDKEIRGRDEANIRPYAEMVDLLKYLMEHDWDVFIVTASPQWIIEEVANEFNLSPEKVIGMNLAVEKDLSQANIIEPFTYGKGKVEALLKKTGRLADIALGDSINDYPLLESATRKGFLIDRGNADLKETCEKIGCMTQPVFL